jgi:hypothetical protein
MRRRLYWWVVWLNDRTEGRDLRLQSRLWVAGWAD